MTLAPWQQNVGCQVGAEHVNNKIKDIEQWLLKLDWVQILTSEVCDFEQVIPDLSVLQLTPV